MNVESLAKDYTRYNLWANQKIVHWLKKNPLEKVEEKCDSSFPTIFETIMHILGAQLFYMSHLRKEEKETFTPDSTEQLLEKLIDQSNEMVVLVNSFSKEDMKTTRNVHGRVLNGDFSFIELIQTCMNHGTYHRGQMTTMAYQLGLSRPPSTDYIYYRQYLRDGRL